MYVMVRHKVQDYAKWKKVFDEDASLIEKAGFKKYGLYRTAEDPTDLLLFLEIDDVNKVKEFMSSDKSKERMKEGSVIGTPELVFLDRIEKKDYSEIKKVA